MAKKVQVTQVSDLDGKPADETVSFGLDGIAYEIDLSAHQAREMRGELAPFTGRARKLRGPRRRPARVRRSARNDLPEIREYARARGYDIRERGQVPKRIVQEYDLLQGYSAAAQAPAG